MPGTVTWGHVTGVVEANTRTFSGNWTGTGGIALAGDAERIDLNVGENMVSEVWDTGAIAWVILHQNLYDPTGDDATLEFRQGASAAACQAASWEAYVIPFESLGYVQVRLSW
jgi:hypothetical protein